jgi:diguanylate cyclase (GGDEF)-like protein
MNVNGMVTGSSQETGEYRCFLISVCLAVAMCVSAIILGMALRSGDLLAIGISALLTIILVISLILYFFSRLEKIVKDSQLSLETMASLDGLTGLYNRRTLDRRFAEELTRHRRKGRNLACILGDLDHFKVINDEFGHLAGDEILKQVAGILSGSLRNYDIVGRFGGEEFLILLPETPIDSAAAIAGRLRSKVSDKVVAHEGKDGGRPVTISFGVAALHETDLKIDELRGRADEALLRAKENGRNRVEISV